MSDAQEANKALRNFFITSGGVEPIEDFEDKTLEPVSFFGGSEPVVDHCYSDAINSGASLFQFYIHVSRVQGGDPILWLSSRQYKTCRKGHKYFQAFPLKLIAGRWETKWRNTKIYVRSDLKLICADTNNETDEFDPWFCTGPKSKKRNMIELTPKQI